MKMSTVLFRAQTKSTLVPSQALVTKIFEACSFCYFVFLRKLFENAFYAAICFKVHLLDLVTVKSRYRSDIVLFQKKSIFNFSFGTLQKSNSPNNPKYKN